MVNNGPGSASTALLALRSLRAWGFRDSVGVQAVVLGGKARALQGMEAVWAECIRQLNTKR